jgi:hypothetical protein
MHPTYTLSVARLRRACRRQLWLLALLTVIGIAATLAGRFFADYLARFPTSTF